MGTFRLYYCDWCDSSSPEEAECNLETIDGEDLCSDCIKFRGQAISAVKLERERSSTAVENRAARNRLYREQRARKA